MSQRFIGRYLRASAPLGRPQMNCRLYTSETQPLLLRLDDRLRILALDDNAPIAGGTARAALLIDRRRKAGLI